MTSLVEMEDRRKKVYAFIKRKKKVYQADIVNNFQDKFSDYKNRTTYRISISDMLRTLEKRELIKKTVDKKSKSFIPQNIWEVVDGN